MTDVCVFRQIMSLSNCLMYEGRLECGSERTASALLTLPFLLSVQSEFRSFSKTHPLQDLTWIQVTLLPSNPVCFLDCSMVGRIYRIQYTSSCSFRNMSCSDRNESREQICDAPSVLSTPLKALKLY